MRRHLCRVLEVEKISQSRAPSATDAIAATIVPDITIRFVIVAVSTALARSSLKRFILDKRDQFFEFAPVEPDAAGGGAHVEFDAVAKYLAHRRAADRGG